MKRFYKCIGLIFSLIILGIVSKLLAKKASLSDLELSKIIDHQNKLFQEGENWSEDELTRHAQIIVSSYESFLLENPHDFHALILFGKFLRKTGQFEHAVSLFLEADKINPQVAVIKQEIGNFLVEDGRPVEAFPFFLMSTRIEPNQPIYHYNLGNFIFLFEEKLSHIENSKELSALMHESFKQAALLDPNNFDYHLRFAQSFFDFEESDRKAALLAWNTLLVEFGSRSDHEIDYIRICQARILIDLNRKEEAIKILQSVNSKGVEKEKLVLLKKVSSSYEKRKENQKKKKPSSGKVRRDDQKSGFLDPFSFPIDPHLQKLKRITAKLMQDKLLENFKLDVLKARILPSGELSLEISNAINNQTFEK